MINTIVRGTPSTYPPMCDGYQAPKLKYLVRTFFLEERKMYVTKIWRMQEAEHDFWWIKDTDIENLHLKKDDTKEEVLKDERSACTYFWDHICTHRNRISNRRIGELHLEICYEIIEGNFWDGHFAMP